jgi:alpha/beta superfamily hydrolase
VAFLKERGVDTIVVLGHSLGSTMASYYLSTDDRDIQGFVAIGMPAGIEKSDVLNAKMVAEIKIPLLDLYGSEDSADVLEAVPLRQEVEGRPYRSEKVEGANHFFDGKEDALVDSVNNWLTATTLER